MRDQSKELSEVQSVYPQAVTSTKTSTTIDLAGYESVTILIDVGTWTDGTHTFSIQDSDDDSSYTATAAADLVGTLPVVNGTTKHRQIYEIGYVPKAAEHRYLQVVNTVTASPSTGLVYGVVAVRGRPRTAPVA